MNRLIAIATLAGALCAAPGAAQATSSLGTAAATASSDIVLVADGCGPRGFRDRFGRCVRRGPPRPMYRRCPPGLHPTPYGCRRF